MWFRNKSRGQTKSVTHLTIHTKKEWRYYDEERSSWTHELISLADLDDLHAKGKVRDSTHVISAPMLRRGPRASGIPYSAIARIDIDLSPDPEVFHADRAKEVVTVLCGPNNSGKTLYLKQLFSVVGHGGYLVSCNRFSHVDVLNTRQQEENQYRNYYDNFIQNWYSSSQNTEESEYKLEQALTALTNDKRKLLFALCRTLLGSEISLKRTQENNEFSPFYVDIDGQNLRYASTGTRLLITLLGVLLNDRFSTLLIDEPEIGLSPKAQTAVARLLFDPASRKEHWPHLQHLYIATHSHLLLDRTVITNNHVVTKSEKRVSVSRVHSMGEFHQLQFTMLGNEFESMFLPSVILIVEGDSDVTFLTKALSLHIPDKKVAVVRGGGDGGILNKLNVLRETFGDIASGPYGGRIFVLLDQKHSARGSRLEGLGVPRKNIVVWAKNGIEYYYPARPVQDIFRCSAGDVDTLGFEQDSIEFNGIRKSKRELAQAVSERLALTDTLHPELADVVERLRTACG